MWAMGSLGPGLDPGLEESHLSCLEMLGISASIWLQT